MIDRGRSKMQIDRRAFIASLGGTAAVALMDAEARRDALRLEAEEVEQLAAKVQSVLATRLREQREAACVVGSPAAGARAVYPELYLAPRLVGWIDEHLQCVKQNLRRVEREICELLLSIRVRTLLGCFKVPGFLQDLVMIQKPWRFIHGAHPPRIASLCPVLNPPELTLA